MPSIDELAQQWRDAQRVARQVGGRAATQNVEDAREALATATKQRRAA